MMKRKSRKILSLAIITIILGIFLANDFYNRWKRRKDAEIDDINIPAFATPASEVFKFSINTRKFIKLSGNWYIDDIERIPADTLKVNYFLTYLNSIKKIRVFTPDPAIDYGFTDDSITINDKHYELGNYTFNPQTVYLKHPKGKVFVISREIKSHIKTQIVYWFNKEIGINLEDINRISLLVKDKNSFSFDLEKHSINWHYITNKNTRFMASNDSVEKLILALKNMRGEMILYNNLFGEKNNEIVLTLKNNQGSTDKLLFFKSKPEGFIEESCFYNKNNSTLSYHVNCSAHGFLSKSKNRYMESADFSVSRDGISAIELRTRQYFLRLNKINAGCWDFEGKNVIGHVNSLFSFFEDLTFTTTCKKNCSLPNNIENSIKVNFFNDSGETTKQFLFNFSNNKSWFKSSTSKKTFLTDQNNYYKLDRIIEYFSNF